MRLIYGQVQRILSVVTLVKVSKIIYKTFTLLYHAEYSCIFPHTLVHATFCVVEPTTSRSLKLCTTFCFLIRPAGCLLVVGSTTLHVQVSSQVVARRSSNYRFEFIKKTRNRNCDENKSTTKRPKGLSREPSTCNVHHSIP